MSLKSLMIGVAMSVAAVASPALAGPQFAVWLDGNTTPGGGGNGILTSLDHAFGAGDYTLVSTSDLETPGFLDAYSAIIVSRYDSSFGGSLSAAAAANVAAYVGSGASQGGVAVLTNDAADNFYGATGGDPFDANLDTLFTNAATFAAKSGHGYIGEFNGAVMAFDSNSAGFSSLGLLQGSAGELQSYGPQFTYGVGPIGAGNPIDAGVTFPFTDSDDTTFLTEVTGANPGNVVDVYTSQGIDGLPAVLANSYVITGGVSGAPEPATWLMMMAGVAFLGSALRGWRRRSPALSTAV